MTTTTLSDFSKDVKKYVESVTDDFETLIINKGKDNGVVLISLKEYNSILATKHEISSKKNKKRLDSAIKKIEKGRGFEKRLLQK